MPLAAFRSEPWLVGSRTDLRKSLRYLAQRISEQQDEATLLAASGASVLDPLSATKEAARVAASHHSDGQPTYKLTRRLLRNVQATLTAHRADLVNWFPGPFTVAKAALAAALSPRPGVDPAVHLRNASAGLARNDLPLLASALVDASVPYRRRLLERIITAAPVSQADWRSLDTAINLFGATLVAEGRDGAAFAESLVEALVTASDHRAAEDSLRQLVAVASAMFDVAVVLVGSAEPQDTDAFDCTLITSPQRWPHGASQRADTKLSRFRRTHASSHGRSLLATSVEAFDAYGARAHAEAKVQMLVDQYSARHRVLDLGIAPSVLVLRRPDERSYRLHRTVRRGAKVYARTSGPLPQLIDTFRYAALARAESAPVVQVLHRWIALEALGHGAHDHASPQGTGGTLGVFRFIRGRVADLVALHAIRQSQTATWKVMRSAARKSASAPAWREVERWLGVSSSGRVDDLTRWTALLAAEPTSPPASMSQTTRVRRVARFVAGQLADFNPFAEQSFRRWQDRLRDAAAFRQWVDQIREQAHVALVRMYALRNASVHTALGHAEGAQQLTIAARNIVDAVVEVLPNWLEGTNRPGWEALNLISLRFHRVMDANAGTGAVQIDMDRLTLDEGDGIRPRTQVL